MTAKKTAAKKAAPKADAKPAPEPASLDPLVLAGQLETFSVSKLADDTGVPAREIRMALQPMIDAGDLVRGPDGRWRWTS